MTDLFAPATRIALLMAAGFNAADAVRWVQIADAMLPANADPWTWLPVAAVQAAILDAAAVADARADWIVHAPIEWKLLLDDLAAPAESLWHEADFYNLYHEPAGTATGGQFAKKPTSDAPIAPPRLSNHARQRMQERRKYQSVKATMQALERTATPGGPWYCGMQRQGKLDGWLVGENGVVKTVLGAWYDKGKLRGDEVLLSEAIMTSHLDIRRSIEWQLDHLTPEMARTFCEMTEIAISTPAQLVADWRNVWQDWTADGLEMLLLARSETEDPEPDDA